MDSELLYILALIFNFIGMAFSLWFAIYILARSDINHFAFRAIAALLAMAFYFYCAFTWIVDPSVDTAALRSFAIVIALVAGHDLTFYLLPEDLRKKRYLLAIISRQWAWEAYNDPQNSPSIFRISDGIQS